MLKSIEVENFKCFKKQEIPLADLSIFTGFNAAGKSTAIQSILLARQVTVENNGQAYLPLNGEVVKLGTIGDALNHYAAERVIKLTYCFNHGSLQFILEAKERTQTAFDLPNGGELYSLEQHNESLTDTIFIGATRQGTKDVFPVPEAANPIFSDVGETGQYAAWWFDRYSDEDIDNLRQHRLEEGLTLRRQLNAWLSDLFPGAQVNTSPINRTPLVRLEFKLDDLSDWKRPANVGYGLTYAFPILLAGLLAKKGQTLVVDSPEAHLHPRGQSRIGHFLGVVAASGVQVIVETHSDHVLNGIRLAVANKIVKKEQVVIHFFESVNDDDGRKAHITSPQIDVNGNLSEWPEGFFDQLDQDIASLNGWG